MFVFDVHCSAGHSERFSIDAIRSLADSPQPFQSLKTQRLKRWAGNCERLAITYEKHTMHCQWAAFEYLPGSEYHSGFK